MNQFQLKRGVRLVIIRAAVASIIPLTMLPTSANANSDSAPIVLTAPSGIPDVAPLPFTGIKAPVFTTPSTMKNLTVTPSQGVVGIPITITGAGLSANTSIALTWSTADGAWLVDVLPSTVDYRGVSYSKYHVIMANVTTDSSGNFSYSMKAPSDFGGIKEIYAVQNDIAVAKGGFVMNRTLSISPTSGPVGTPITVTYTGIGPSLYTGGGAILYDNAPTGFISAQWTRGTGKVVIRASGAKGEHYIEVKAAVGIAYLNIVQSPVPYANDVVAIFRVTKDNGAPASYIRWPAQVVPTITQRTTLAAAGLDPMTKAVATLSTASGPVGTKVKLSVTGLTSTGTHSLKWASVVGNRVNCGAGGSCWDFVYLPLGEANVIDGKLSQEITIPDNLGGWHAVQVMKGDKIQAQEPFYVKASIVPFYDKKGKVISMGTAKVVKVITPESVAKGNSGEGSRTFKQGEAFTVSIKGGGWTQMDNTFAVLYDNNYIGYGCSFNSNGYTVFTLRATGAPGTHIIDLYPVLYTLLPSFTKTPYGMLPILSSDRDFPGLALGYQVPSLHFAITITK